MNLQLERKRQDRREELLSAIELLNRRYTTRLGLADEYRHNDKEHAYWFNKADTSNRAAKRLYSSYQKLLT